MNRGLEWHPHTRWIRWVWGNNKFVPPEFHVYTNSHLRHTIHVSLWSSWYQDMILDCLPTKNILGLQVKCSKHFVHITENRKLFWCKLFVFSAAIIHTDPLYGHLISISPRTSKHDDVIKWKHFPHYWPFVWGIHRSAVDFPHKDQSCFDAFLSAPEQTVEQTIETLVIWDAIALIMTSPLWQRSYLWT